VVGGFGSGDGERVDTEVFAVAAVGVGIEIADDAAFDGGADAGAWRKEFCYRKSKDQIADCAGLGEADGCSGGVADAVRGCLGLLAEADDEETLGGETGGGVEQEGLIGSALEFPTGEGGGGRGLDRFVCGEEDRVGFGVGGFRSLGVDG